MEAFYDELMIDRFKRALLTLVDEVARERGRDAAVPLVASWACKRPGTIYNWLDGKDTKPGDPFDTARISLGSTEAGFFGFARVMFLSPACEVSASKEGRANGTLADERRACDEAWTKGWQGESSANGHLVAECGRGIIAAGQNVVAEGERMLARAAPAPRNGVVRSTI